MKLKHIIDAVHVKLFASSALAAIVGTNIHYARGPVDATWPQVVYFDVTEGAGVQLDYNSATIQFSMWALDQYQALEIKSIIEAIFNRMSEKITTYYGVVDINYTQFVDSTALPEADPFLFGQQVRFLFRYRGTNLGG